VGWFRRSEEKGSLFFEGRCVNETEKVMYKYFAILIVGVFFSCKSKAVLAEGKAKDVLSSDQIVASHYTNKKEFSTLYIKSNAHYEDDKQSHKVTAEIKIKKDEMILISIRFIGITMAKALITPTEVKYYEKISNSFFHGDYTTLSRWLGSDLDFAKVQNMLIGEALDDLSKGKFTANISDQMFRLEDSTDLNTTKAYFFESDKYLIKKQQVTQKEQDRTLQILYPNYADYNQILMPTNINIEAIQNKGKTNIYIDYNSITVNEELSFPYSVPEGYEQIFIN
jgi:hypothetical protein